MRIFSISDIHLDYKENLLWLQNLSNSEFLEDVLILAGDISDDLDLLELCFQVLSRKFKKICFVPGNHDLWVRKHQELHSIEKFEFINQLAKDHHIETKNLHLETVDIIPLLSWYDFSFGSPNVDLSLAWMDFKHCVWPKDFNESSVSEYFHKKNEEHLESAKRKLIGKSKRLISFSHFLPRIDLIPERVPEKFDYLHPIMGSTKLETQLRTLNRDLKPKDQQNSNFHTHIYGHSHINVETEIAGIRYINSAYGYPGEERISKKRLKLIYED